MRLVFEEEALDDFQRIFAWIAKEDPSAAKDVVNQLFEKAERLLTPELVHMGRPGRDAGTHELIEGPYMIVYEVLEIRQEVVVLAIVHGRQGRGIGGLRFDKHSRPGFQAAILLMIRPGELMHKALS